MKRNVSLAVAAAVVLAVGSFTAAPAAHAADAPRTCAKALKKPVGAAGKSARKKIGLFDASGKFLETVPASDIDADAVVEDCKEDLGLVQIKVSGKLQWVDRLDVDIRLPENAPCVVESNRQRPDHVEPVSSGAGEHCEPTKPENSRGG